MEGKREGAGGKDKITWDKHRTSRGSEGGGEKRRLQGLKIDRRLSCCKAGLCSVSKVRITIGGGARSTGREEAQRKKKGYGGDKKESPNHWYEEKKEK